MEFSLFSEARPVFYIQLVVMNIIVDAVNSSLMNPDDCGDSKTASVRR